MRNVIPAPVRAGLRAHRPLLATALLSGLVGVVALTGLVVDDRVLTGAPIWMKPLKFAVSIAVYAATLAWMVGLLERGRRWAHRFCTVIAVMVSGELVLIDLQVIRGRTSHFNVETPLDTVIYGGMATMVIALWASNLLVGVLLLVERLKDRPLASALRAGTAIALAGMAEAFVMTRPTPSQREAARNGADLDIVGAHSVGVEDGGPGLPLVGWSTTGGDLRVGHFVGIHALQALPLLALALGVLAGRIPVLQDVRTRTHLVRVAAVGYAGLFSVVTWQALRGQPLIRPDVLTLGALAAVVGVTTVAATLVLVRGRRQLAAATPGTAQDDNRVLTPAGV